MKEQMNEQLVERLGTRIGIDHVEFCVHKIAYYQKKGKQLLCKDCPNTNCKFYGLSV